MRESPFDGLRVNGGGWGVEFVGVGRWFGLRARILDSSLRFAAFGMTVGGGMVGRCGMVCGVVGWA